MCWICTFSAGYMSLTICSSRNDICSIEPSPCPPLRVLISSQSWYHHNHYIITIMIPSQSWYHHNPDIITIMISSYIIISSHPVIITIMISSQSTIIDNALKMITDHLLLQHSSQRSCLLHRPGVGRRGLRNIYIYTHILYTHKDLSSGTTFLEMKLLPQCVVNSFPVWLPPPFLIMNSPAY